MLLTETYYYLENQVFGVVNNRDMSLIEMCICSRLYRMQKGWVVLSIGGDTCKNSKKDCRLVPTHSFTNPSLFCFPWQISSYRRIYSRNVLGVTNTYGKHRRRLWKILSMLEYPPSPQRLEGNFKLNLLFKFMYLNLCIYA